MIVGVLMMVLRIESSKSLKDKRQVVKSVLDSARNRFNISAAEIGMLDAHRESEIAFACVSNDIAVANRILDQVFNVVESNPMCEIIESHLELL